MTAIVKQYPYLQIESLTAKNIPLERDVFELIFGQWCEVRQQAGWADSDLTARGKLQGLFPVAEFLLERFDDFDVLFRLVLHRTFQDNVGDPFSDPVFVFL